MNKSWCVYKHTNKLNGKSYVGVTSQPVRSRWKDGEGYRNCTLFYRAIQKYSWDGFTHEILFTDLTESEAKQCEISLIQELKSNAPSFGYNLTNGGDGMSGYSMSEETRQKLRLSRLGRFCGENSPNYGKHPSIETRHKMSIAKKELYLGSGNPFYGKSHSEESKRKISETKFANGMVSETPVICIDTGRTYRSISDASRHTGCNTSAISKCCRGIYKSTHGLRWEYSDNKEVVVGNG